MIRKLYNIIFLFVNLLLLLFTTSCIDKKIQPAIETTIELYLEELYSSEVWLRVVLSDSGEVRNFKIERDDVAIITGSVIGLDTLVVDNTVQLNQTYTYIAYVTQKGRTYNSSSPVQVIINDSTASQFKFLGFEDKFVVRLRPYYPYLYACTGGDGLWRKNLELLISDWEYLGLSDTTFGVYGVMDVVVKMDDPKTMLVAFHPTYLPDPRNIYKTTDDGMTWTLADSGLYYQVSGTDDYVSDHPHLFLDYQVVDGKVFAFSGGLYKSENFGEIWENVESFGYPGGGGVRYNDVKYHPKHPNNVWIGGQTARGEPTLSKSVDYGATWEVLELRQHAVPFYYSVGKISFNPEDPNIVYVSSGGKVNKTEDGGVTWTSSLILPEGALTATIVPDPELRGHLFIATYVSIAETWNEGGTWTEIDFPDEFIVRGMIYDNETKSIFLRTNTGVYQYFPIASVDAQATHYTDREIIIGPRR